MKMNNFNKKYNQFNSFKIKLLKLKIKYKINNKKILTYRKYYHKKI